MDVQSVADLFVTATNKIEFYWNFFVVTLIALIGWLVSIKRPLSVSLKLLITAGYLVFVAMNVLGLYGSYTFAEALRTDLLSMEGAKALPHTHKVLQTQSYVGQRTGMFWIHAIVGVAVLLVVWLGHFGEKNDEESRRRKPER